MHGPRLFDHIVKILVLIYLGESIQLCNQTNGIQKFIKKKLNSPTGWSISFLYTLTGLYDNNNACMKKLVVDLLSVHLEISFDNKQD